VRRWLALEQILARLEPLDVEGLARRYAVALTQGRRQDELAFAGNDSLHLSKMASYMITVNFFSSFQTDELIGWGARAPINSVQLVNLVAQCQPFDADRRGASDGFWRLHDSKEIRRRRFILIERI
jgi:hypothetical protein